MDTALLPDFTGKVVTFYINHAPHWAVEGLVLESPSFVRQGERLFLVGRTVEDTKDEDEQNWSANLDAGVAWDSVFYFLVIGTREDWDMRRRQYQEPVQKQFVSSFYNFMGMAISTVLLVGLVIWVAKLLQ